MWSWGCIVVLIWRSENNLQELILSFRYVDTTDQTVRLDNKSLHLLSHHTVVLIFNGTNCGFLVTLCTNSVIQSSCYTHQITKLMNLP